MSNVHQIRTKTMCQVCGNGYGDEENMLGRCHGLPLIEVPWTKADYENNRKRKEAIQQILAEAKKLNWD